MDRIEINTWCKSCGICISRCPRGVLEADAAGKPAVAQPDRCTACKMCEYHCPDFAILVHKEVSA